ncbi:MAG: PAS domain-containing protein [Syntrophobacteraceae bacterium]|nr:PAS domain-containing protein [Syntrophobacteraceae bacterium]
MFEEQAGAPIKKKNLDFLAGGGEMAERIRAFDWSKTVVGNTDTWSPALQRMTRFLLANRFPMLLWWGPQYISIYNDAYRPVLGEKHPWALGQPVSECWKENWSVLQPLIDTPFSGGPATWNEDLCLELNRHGYVEEAHFTIAYSPVPDETAAGGIGGVLATVHEISEKIFGDRREKVLRELGGRSAGAKTAFEACAAAAKTLGAHPLDIPFSLLYLIGADRRTARLAGAAAVGTGPEIITLAVEDAGDSVWPLREAMRSEAMQTVTDLLERPGVQVAGGAHTAAILPIHSNKGRYLEGFLVAGISPRIKLDEPYREFLKQVASQIATSIANARQYEEEKKRAETLSEVDRAKTTFFSNISHEFRTPLSLMLGPIEELLSKDNWELSPAAKEQLEVTHRNGKRLLRLVNTLLDFSRIEAGRVQALFEPTELGGFTAELASLFRSAIERVGLRLTVDCATVSEPVYVDREMWEKIVLNLVANAFKFTFEGEIGVTLKTVDGRAQLRVCDTGVGIAAKDLDRLFERFHRLANRRSRTHEGSGIGLALVQELARLHGGSVAVESRLGEGTSFIVSVPLGHAHLPEEQVGGAKTRALTSAEAAPFVEEAMRRLPEASPTEAGGAFPKDDLPPAKWSSGAADESMPRLLVADDNADMRQYLAHMLGSRYDVRTVSDGQAALEAARQTRPDLILSDIMMPRLDGLGLLRTLRSDPTLRTIPVILLSARAGEESLIEGLREEADDYLIKPFSAGELLARVASHLNLARLRKKSEEELRLSEERFRAFVTASSDVIYRMSPDWSKLRQLKSQEISLDIETPFTPWLEKFIHPDDRPKLLDAIKEAIGAKSPFESEHRVLREDGAVWWTFSRAVPLLDHHGEVIEWFGTAKDITERKRYEEALREAEEEKSLILDNISEAIAFYDTQMNLIRCNRSFLKMTGSKLSEIKGRKCYSSWGVDRQCINCPVVAAIETGKPREAALTPANQPHWPADCSSWHVRATPVKDSGGKIIGAIAVGTDITEIKQAEDELRVSKETLDAFFNAFPGVIYIKDEELRYIKAGKTLSAHFGIENEAMAGRASSELAPDVIRDYGAMLRRVIETGTPEQSVEIKSPVPAGSGGTVYRQASYFPVPLPGGMRGLGCVAIDITERKEAEEKLFKANQRLKALMDGLPVGVSFSNDVACIDITGNRTVRAQFEIGPDNLFPSLLERCTQESRVRFFKDGREVRFSELPLKLAVEERRLIAPTEVEVLLPGGRRWMAEASAAPIFDEEGNISGGVAVTVDITERKKMEEELRELTQRLSYHVDHSPLAVIEFDADLRINRWSGAAERMFGWSAEEVIGKRVEDFHWIYEQDQSQVAEVMGELTSGANPQRFSSNHNYRKNGSVAYCEWYNSSLPDDSGNLRSILSLALDVTDRHRMEEELRRSKEELESRVYERTAALEAANEKLRLTPSLLIQAQETDRQRLAADLHDSIGQTLAALKFRIEHISDKLRAGQSDEAVRLLDEFVPILQRSIGETRTIYMGLKPTILSDHGILATLEWYRRQLMAIYPGIHIELEAKISEEAIREELKIAIFRIVQEALNNCCKHSQTEWADVRLAGSNGAIELEISDEGVGMELDFILESASAKSLGLLGMRERAELSAGEFTISSCPGEGTTVRVRWPDKRLR